MFEQFTDRARRVVVLAQEEARLLNHNYIGTEHVLLGLIQEGEGVAAATLRSLDISLQAVRASVEEIIGRGGQLPAGHIPFTPRAKKVLELSLREALHLGHNYIGTEHILLGLVREGEGVAAQVLVKLGADLDRVRAQVIVLLSGPFTNATMPSTVVMPSAARVVHSPQRGVCALCGRDLWEVARFVRGASGTVCDECLRLAAAVLDTTSERETLVPARAYGDPPPEPEDLAAIQAAFDAAAAGDAAAVEDGERLMPYQAENIARHPGIEARTIVQRVRLVADDRAEVRFVLDVMSMNLQIPREGVVCKRGGRWIISRETFIEGLRLGGARPPDANS